MVWVKKNKLSRYLKEANYLKCYKRETGNQITIELIQILSIFFYFSALDNNSLIFEKCPLTLRKGLEPNF